MQPRWYKYWKDRSTLSDHTGNFLGGVERFDLWLDAVGDLRVVWGDNDSKWTWYMVVDGQFGPDPSEIGPPRESPTRDELVLIAHYLNLFAPSCGLTFCPDSEAQKQRERGRI